MTPLEIRQLNVCASDQSFCEHCDSFSVNAFTQTAAGDRLRTILLFELAKYACLLIIFNCVGQRGHSEISSYQNLSG